MHKWGDEGVDWKGIGDAAHWIGVQLRRWGRVGVIQTKEKFGTARVYCHFGWSQVHCVTHPGYAYNQYPKWLWVLDCNVGSRLIGLVGRAVIPYQRWLYRRVYFAAVKRWPHLEAEILDGADYSELLKRAP